MGRPVIRAPLPDRTCVCPCCCYCARLTDETARAPVGGRYALTHPRYGPFPKGKAEPPVGVNLQRLIKLAQSNYKLEPTNASTLNPVDVVKKVRELLPKLEIVKGTDRLSLEAQKVTPTNAVGTLLHADGGGLVWC